MNDKLRTPSDLAQALQAQRKVQGLSVTAAAERAGKTRDVIYRLENGEDVTVASLMALLGALGLALRLEKAGMPSLQDVQKRFGSDEDDDAA